MTRSELIEQLELVVLYAKSHLSPEAADIAVLAIGLAVDFIGARKDAVSHLRSLRKYVQTGLR